MCYVLDQLIAVHTPIEAFQDMQWEADACTPVSI